jgi:hypothetical protein
VWSAGSDVLDVYLGTAEAGLERGGSRLHWQTHASLEVALDAVFKQAEIERPARWGRKAAVRVWLSGALARPFLCGPISGLNRWRDVETVAQSMATDVTGIAPPCIVQVEEWPSPQAAMAVAIGEQTAQVIETAARAHGIRVKSLRPWWAAALNRALTIDAQARLVAVADGDAMTLLGGQAGRFDTATGYVPAPSQEQAQQLLARMALTAGVPLDDVVHMRLARADEAAVGMPFGVAAAGAA